MRRPYSCILKKGEGWYVAHCPELQVTSQGKTRKSARANLREAIELYLETWPPQVSRAPHSK